MTTDADKSGYLVTEKLVKRFDEAVAVDEVSLSISQGEIFALLGSSGCGKSTLLRIMTGELQPSSGSVALLGGLRVGLLDVAGRPLPGFGVEECDPVLINATGVVVSWRGNADLSALRGRDVSLEFWSNRTKLYSFRFE